MNPTGDQALAVISVLLVVVFVVGAVSAAIYALYTYFVTDGPQRERVRAKREAQLSEQLDGEAVHRWLDQAGS